jgi:hypothetical protein
MATAKSNFERLARGTTHDDGVMHLGHIPPVVPRGILLVHNRVRPTRRLGSRGFRAWFALPDATKFVVCPCRWAPELRTHYRVRAAGKVH